MMKTYNRSECGEQFDDRCQWVPAEVAQEMYDALELAEEILAQEQFYTSALKVKLALQRADKGE